MLLGRLDIPLEVGDGFPLTLGTVPQICFFVLGIFLGIGPNKMTNFLPADRPYDLL